MARRFDFYTADNAEPPHVKVYRVDKYSTTFAEVPIAYGNINEAERIAEIICAALCRDWSD
jgi:hypothetical protein